MGPSDSVLIFDDLMHGQRRIPILSPGYKKHWRAWPGQHTSPLWTSKVDFGRSVWHWSCSNIPHSVGNLGFYEFTRMPFRLCNMPATFQHLMQNTLGELNLTYCIIYLDNVIVYSHTEEEHLERLWIVLECFREFNLKLKPSKCSFFQSEIVYLTHHMLKEGIPPSDDNIRAILEFPMPETYTEIRAFCGLSGHYRHFIRNFACLGRALYDLLGDKVKMGPVTLTPEAEEVVCILKEKITSAPVLVFPDFNKPFLLETDASKEGLGAVLSQKQDDGHYHPVAFGSRMLTSSEQNYHSSKLEFLALKWSVTEHFKEYLAYAPYSPYR